MRLELDHRGLLRIDGRVVDLRADSLALVRETLRRQSDALDTLLYSLETVGPRMFVLPDIGAFTSSSPQTAAPLTLESLREMARQFRTRPTQPYGPSPLAEALWAGSSPERVAAWRLHFEYEAWRDRAGLNPTAKQMAALRRMQDAANEGCGCVFAGWMAGAMGESAG